MIATSPRTPAISSLKRNWIGWLTSNRLPSWSPAAFSMRASTCSFFVTPTGHWSCGFRMTNASETFGGIGSVATSAVPVFENISSTSGSLRTASSTWSCIASDWPRLTEGTRVEASATFFSSSWGMNSDPSRPKAGMASRKKASPPPMNGQGRAIAMSRSGRYRSFDLRISQTSFSATLPRMNSATSAGTSVIARMNAAPRASMIVMAIGEKVLPSTPVNISSGAKASRMIACPKTVGLIISCDARIVSSSRSRRMSSLPSCSCRCARRARQFSMMMTAPSTMSPKSSAPRLIRLPGTPNARMPIAIIRNENGMTSTAMIAARQLPSSRNRAAATSSAPSVRLRSTVETVALTSLARSSTTCTLMPGGRVFATCPSLSPTALATTRLFSPISISAVPTTASSPFMLAAPVRRSPPTFTLASWPTVTGTPPRVAATALRISSTERILASARTR
ncbi:Predicted cell-wall-anchored protein SasA (LPXTG motif) [hydrothermal vent metagenome]|uniref:Predicted cell-wall-anchored protein SasA (LPXTG motif) n=1 Tax=hydrothermal vent metagenome TaxID=652676 RepID=A0A160THF5_9ZZZZ